ncbi:LuxR family transcriptional regulator [Streptomyces endocoffeicus]|uniref:LuxR family transcriptional regulator n=1 Tax=Streptomyces endocoffeicus TaxID=2898945 RepID=UPI001E5E1B10|nr:LuxR family transcriptional regulator [Streptomyces endocoffeicus]
MRVPTPAGAGVQRQHDDDDGDDGPRHPGDDGPSGGSEDDGRPADDITEELLAVRALIESTVVKHRDRQLRNSWVAAVEADDKEVHAAAQDLLRTATERVDVVLAAEAAHVHVLHGALDGWLRSGGDTVRTRMLCAQNTVDWGFVQRHVGDENALEVRVARIPLLAALIVDGRAALVCADSAAGRRASTLRDSGVIETLQTLFDGIWRTALSVSERIELGERSRGELVRPILERLRLGATDEVAARELAVSVRTYRRYVAEIMALLGANSRFQAGVRAAELGLLPMTPSQDPPKPWS